MTHKFCRGCVYKHLYNYRNPECHHPRSRQEKESFKGLNVWYRDCKEARGRFFGFCGSEGKHYSKALPHKSKELTPQEKINEINKRWDIEEKEKVDKVKRKNRNSVISFLVVLSTALSLLALKIGGYLWPN